MFDHVLVPLDGSQLAEIAMGPAITIARQNGGKMTLLSVPVRQHVILPSSAGYGPPVYDQTSEDALKREEAYLAGIRDTHVESKISIDTKVEVGDVAGVIVDTAVTENVDLIIMTTHGYSGLTRWVLGSITERVLRASPCPVLVIRHAGPLKKAMITLDGSRLAERALKPGVEIGRLLDCETTLFRVDQQEKLSSVEMGFLEVASSELCQELSQDDADRVSYYLECVADKFESVENPLQKAVVKGKPAEQILEFIDEQQIDLVSIATHGYTGLKRWTYGGVTEKILRKAECAMLIVRPPTDELN